MHITPADASEAAVLRRIVEPNKPTFSACAARGILALDFSATDKERMCQLSAKAQEGTLTAAEQNSTALGSSPRTSW